jgi:hypothetical protein
MQKAPCTGDSVQGALRWRQGSLVCPMALDLQFPAQKFA